jgi:LuxR family transcriptional regulator, quorum-sensing system regulator CciR
MSEKRLKSRALVSEGKMGRFRDVQNFVREANEAEDLNALHGLMDGTVQSMGCTYYALGHHVNVASDSHVRIGTYPTAWMETLHENRYIYVDPVLTACQNTAVGFRWSNVDQLIELSTIQREILSLASKAGMGDGFTVPIHIPGESAGSVSFAMGAGRDFKEAMVPAMQYVGCFGFEAARRLVNGGAKRRHNHEQTTRLTSRQLDCVLLVARGKSDWDSSKLLGISEQTVHQHVETAKRKYGVGTRTQLVIRALFDNQLGFRDVIGR